MSRLTQQFSQSQDSYLSQSSQCAQNSVSNREDSLRSVTIRQLLQATEMKRHRSSFKIGQDPLGKFILVANVNTINIDDSRRRVNYSFNDGTGIIQGFKMLQPDGGHPSFPQFDYVSISGELQLRSNRFLSIKVLHMRRLHEPHEIYFHILHTIYDTVCYTQGPPQAGDIAAAMDERETDLRDVTLAVRNMSLSGEHLTSSSRSESPSSSHRSTSPTPSNATTESDIPETPSGMERAILSCMREKMEKSSSQSEEGVDVYVLVHEVKRLYGDLEAEDFWRASETLLKRNILRVIDDRHYDLHDEEDWLFHWI